MNREIGRWSKATGITRPILGQEEWVELWIGDVIRCRVYTVDDHGAYLHIDTGEVLWSEQYGMYVLDGRYEMEGYEYRYQFPLHKIVNEDFVFIKKVPRVFGHQRDVLLYIAKIIGRLQQEQTDLTNYEGIEFNDEGKQTIVDTIAFDTLDLLVKEITDMGVIPEEEFRKQQENPDK